MVHCHVYIVWCISVRFDAFSAFQCKSWMHSHARPYVLPGIAGKASPQQIQKAHASDKHSLTHLVNSFELFFTKRPCMLHS